MKNNLDIAEVSKASGLPSSTLRYYEEKGLIQSTGRQGLRRVFKDSVIEHLAFISLARAAGFSLDEITEMFTPDGPTVNRNLLLQRANELDEKIKVLTSLRESLKHVAACKAPDHFECPKFLRLLHIAGKNRFRQPNKLKQMKT